MLKKDARPKAVFDNADRCGTCLHFERIPYPGSPKKTCDALGHIASSPKCDYYNPNIALIADKAPKVIPIFSEYVASMTRGELQLFGHMMYSAAETAKAGFTLGQQVWFVIGMDYLNNYFTGIVLRATKEFVYIAAELNEGAGGTFVQLMPSSVLNEKEWLRRRRRLVRAERVVEPRKNGRPTLFEELAMTKKEFVERRQALAEKPADYEPPTLDTVPQHWLDKRHVQSFKADAVAAQTVEQHVKAVRVKKAKAKAKASGKGFTDGKFVVRRS